MKFESQPFSWQFSCGMIFFKELDELTISAFAGSYEMIPYTKIGASLQQ